MYRCLLLFFVLSCLTGCAKTYVNQTPVGQLFPNVNGESLDQQSRKMPAYFSGKPVVLLLGYKQNSQFDIDRWLIGLDMTNTEVDIYELPTIQNWLPSIIQSQINQGMRNGIPEEIWRIVITIYDDGDTVQAFTGNEKPNNARVMLLDADSKVRYFHDRGFSVAALNELRKKLNKIVNQ